MQSGFKTFTSRFSIEPNGANLSACSVARLLYEVTGRRLRAVNSGHTTTADWSKLAWALPEIGREW